MRRPPTNSFALGLAVVVALGVALRAAQTFLVAPWPPAFFNDEAYYATLGELIARGEGFIRPAEFFAEGLSVPTAERAPLLPVALAGLAELGITGGDARLLGVFTGGGTVLVLGLLGRRLAGERAGLIAAALAALYPTLIAADGALMTESLYGLLAALALLGAYRVLEAPTLGRALVLGAIVGVAALARAEALLLLPLLLVPIVRSPGGLRTAATVCLAFAVVLAPWTARNWIEFDRPVLIATEGGETLAGANCDAVYYGDRIGAWAVSCVRFSGRGNEAAELNEVGREGIRYAFDHLERVPLVAGRAACEDLGDLAAATGGPVGLGHLAGPRHVRPAPAPGRGRVRGAPSEGHARLDPDGAVHHGHADHAAGLRELSLPPLRRALARGARRRGAGATLERTSLPAAHRGRGRARVTGRGSVATWLRGHPGAAAALVYGVLSVLLYAPALLPGHTLSASDYLWTAAPWSSERPPSVRPFGANYELVDSTVQFQPWLEYTRERLPEPPLWNPHVAAGRPYMGNPQAAPLSPFSLPAYVLPFWWSLGLIAVLKVFVAAFGTYLLGRALGMRFGGALLAGLVFAFSLYFLAWIAWPLTHVWALLPWLLLLTERVVRAPGLLAGAGLAVVVALQFFGGHPESSFHLLAVTGLFFAFRLVLLRRGGRLESIRAPVAAFAAALIGGAALAAITLVPFLELLSRSSDPEVRESFSQLTLQRKYLLGLALYEYWGRATHAATGAFAQEKALYAGALPLVLAATALIVRPTPQRIGFAVLGALALATVIGLPPLPDLAGQIPIVKTGNHLRLIVILMLCLALLAGWGLDDLSAGRGGRRGLVLGLAIGLLVLPVLVVAARGELSLGVLGRALEIAWGFSWPSPPADSDTRSAIRMAAVVVWLSFMGLAVLLLVARLRWRLPALAFVALALALTAADLFKAGMGGTPAISTSEAKQPLTPAIEYLRSRRPNRFVGLVRELGPSPLLPNLAVRWSLYDVRSYDQPVEERYDRLWRRAVLDGSPTDNPTTGARLTDRALPAFRLLSVTDVVQDPDDPAVREPALPIAYARPDLRVYANPRALPRAGVVAAQLVEPRDDEQLDAVLDPSFDGRRTVVTPERLPGLSSAPARGPAGRARIVSYEPERVVVDATARRPSELVLTDLHYPGWTVTVDGRTSELHRVNYLLRGTALAPGRHRVVFRYEPLSWRIGWIVSLIALAGLLAALAIGLRRRTA